ncbi:S41 family peptidase [Variovorax sp. EL159]|uniref:S41 family peptidase n=1 Tax=Variovorax sp. EL159 TaxID=1566270 RepID=UPI00088554EA|nr:S41 family peptidase [Variovorax sp. EL159]SCX74468.1 C-terminal processing protease CtpA/Prc, contains a PDZ domain [Variovorax sp. EL159]
MAFRKVDMRRLPRPGAWAAAATFAVASLLAGCGGGGGGGGGGIPFAALPGTTPPPATGTGGSSGIVPSATVAGMCASPRSGTNPDTGAAYPDRAGSIDNEKSWVRGWIDETYLWYGEVPTTLKASDYATPVAWFNVLKTTATTASGRAKDRFHFTYDTEVYRQLSQGGVSVSYGAEFVSIATSPPRELRVVLVEPGSPADVAGLKRGAKLVTVDGVDFVNATGTANAATINGALSPKTVGETHNFTFQLGSAPAASYSLKATSVTSKPVQNVTVLDVGGGNHVGYMLFNDHITTAEQQLIDAVNTFKASPGGIQDLVLDMRYNGGGQLAIASRLAYMIAAPSATANKTFEQLTFNDKNPFHFSQAQSQMPFYSTSRNGAALPSLGLSRVTVLTSPDTCSASESVINSLRGVGVTVNLVGGTTCGKPYGFYPQDNCGTTYFAIQVKGVNQLGFGDYGDGFPPTCTVPDDYDHQLGDPNEARLAAALALRSGGSCPTSTVKAAAQGLQKTQPAEAETPFLIDQSPLRRNRLFDLAPNPG